MLPSENIRGTRYSREEHARTVTHMFVDIVQCVYVCEREREVFWEMCNNRG